MTDAILSSVPSIRKKRQFVIERTLKARVGVVWDMWTTERGLEGWWGPEDLVTKVRQLEVRPGGRFELDHGYVGTERNPGETKVSEASGIPTALVAKGTFTQVRPKSLLSFEESIGFDHTPRPFELSMRVAFHPEGESTRMVIIASGDPTPHWTKLAKSGLNSQVDRLARAVET